MTHDGAVVAGLGNAMLRPVRGHHAFEFCVEQLATAIRLGGYPDGGALPPERELAERMGVSRATLREAMAALREAGLIETHRGRGGGTVVAYSPETPGSSHRSAPPRVEILDALNFRRIVEPGAAATAATRHLTDEQQSTLRTALADVNGAERAAAHRQADSRFHLAIASLTESELLIEAVTKAQRKLHDMLSAIPVLDRNIDHSNSQHAAIAKAILAHDPVKARRAMESHCDDTAALLRGLL